MLDDVGGEGGRLVRMEQVGKEGVNGSEVSSREEEV